MTRVFSRSLRQDIQRSHAREALAARGADLVPQLPSRPTVRLTRLCSSFLLFFVLLGSLSFFGKMAVAQERSSPSKQPESSQEQQSEREASKHHQKSLAGELAEESRAAAGEDENAQFKKSASLKLLANLLGMTQEHAYWLAVLVNFGVVAAAIVWLSKKFLPTMFRDRTSAIQSAMEEAAKASSDAKCRLAGIESRLSSLDFQIEEMRRQASQESAQEEARIQAGAEEEAHRIVESAEQEIAAAVKQARRELAAYAADLAIAQAQSAIRVDADTDQVLVRGFAEHISGSNSTPGHSTAPKKGGK